MAVLFTANDMEPGGLANELVWIACEGNTMSNFKDTNSTPDGYRALNMSELQELLQDKEKMDQIVRLNEKVFGSTMW